MSWFLAPQSPAGNHAPGPRVGLTAGKVLGKAHERNRIKRRMREAISRHVDLLPNGFDLILHPRRVVLTVEFAKLEAEVVRILEQARADAAHKGAKCNSASSLVDAAIMTRLLLACSPSIAAGSPRPCIRWARAGAAICPPALNMP